MPKPICRMTRAELEAIVTEGVLDEDLIDDAWDELERRDRERDLHDWTEQDARAAAEERLENIRNEY